MDGMFSLLAQISIAVSYTKAARSTWFQPIPDVAVVLLLPKDSILL
jgi:hypothetical protein